ARVVRGAVQPRAIAADCRLHHERAVGHVDRHRASRRTVAVECRTAGEGDRVGDQLRALRTAGRAAARIRETVFRKVDGAGDVLVTAAHQLRIAAVVVVAGAGAGQAILEHRDAGVRTGGRRGDIDRCATVDIHDAGVAAAAVGENKRY